MEKHAGELSPPSISRLFPKRQRAGVVHDLEDNSLLPYSGSAVVGKRATQEAAGDG